MLGRSAWGVIAGASLALGWLAASFVTRGRINHDEGWALYAAQRLLEGELPYRDFPFYQAPLLAIVHAPAQWLWPGVETGRWASFVLSAITCALAIRLAHERGRWIAPAIAFVGLASTPLGLWSLVTTRTEPLSALFLTLAVVAITRERTTAATVGCAVLAAVLAVAARVSVAPAALFVAGYALYRLHRGSARAGEVMRAVVPAGLAALVLGAFTLAGGFARAWFFLVDVQRERHLQFEAPAAFDLSAWFGSRLDLVQSLYIEFGPAVLLALVAVFFWPLRAGWEARRGKVGEDTHALALVSGVVLLAFLPHLAPRYVYPVYFVAVLPLALVVFGWSAARIHEGTVRRFANPLPSHAALLCALVALTVLQWMRFEGQQRLWQSPDPSDLDLLRAAARVIEAEVGPEERLLTFDTYLAVEAQRRVPRGFEMSVFSWFPRRSTEDSEALGLLTNEKLGAAFTLPDVRALALSDQALGILVHRGHFGFQPRRIVDVRELESALPLLHDFELVQHFRRVGQQRAPLYLFTRRNHPTAGNALPK